MLLSKAPSYKTSCCLFETPCCLSSAEWIHT